jgi:acetyl-CoA acetyltransferase
MTGMAAIAGLGITEVGKVYGRRAGDFGAEAVRLAVEDAGLAMQDLDGLLVNAGKSGGLDLSLAETLGLSDLSLCLQVNAFGASAIAMVQLATSAVMSGTATAVACVFADSPLREGKSAGEAYRRPAATGYSGLLVGSGITSTTSYYALAAQRHMARFGTTSQQLGAVAVSQRAWAQHNPIAQMRTPLTIEEHQNSRWVVQPLHLLDCCLVSNGGVAIVVTSAERAAQLRQPPVHVWGWGQGHPAYSWERGSKFGLSTGAVQSGRAAMQMARIKPGDVTIREIYDCYTFTTIVTLEDYGFCAKGEGGELAASGALAPGGALPTNTGGGQLSSFYLWGMTPLSEAVIQARGQGDARQVEANDIVLVSGNGGILQHHSTLVVSPHPPERR